MAKIARIEMAGIVLSLLGIVMMFQPFVKLLFTYGFYLVAIGAFIYILSTYLPRRSLAGETYLKDTVKWALILLGIVGFFVILSAYLAPYLV